MKSTINILKITLLVTWAFLACMIAGSYLFHLIVYIADGNTGKIFSPLNVGFLLVAAALAISFFYVVFRTKAFDLVR